MEETLTALLAPIAGGSRFWTRAPQGTPLPYCVMQRISGVRDYHMQGPSGYVESRVQVDCYAASYGAVKGLARQVIAAMSGYRAAPIQGIFVDNERDLPATDAGEVNHLFRVSIDLIVHHSE